ncbi:hypothetical protein MCNS_31080 [Mycobacterium conspicuum]|uniref:Uncharacterized protein n=1 Tax=Mycobacterium conspicuum TaxID=44010 RepID=A0A7I7YE59_9MYCO|nr:hypothetical protein MCNS_31080 [Mycobacterium conspicuum]
MQHDGIEPGNVPYNLISKGDGLGGRRPARPAARCGPEIPTAPNVVIGYDLSTGIPVEKVRYRTVQQPNTLAFDEASDTLCVVSGSDAGLQAIGRAAGPR